MAINTNIGESLARNHLRSRGGDYDAILARDREAAQAKVAEEQKNKRMAVIRERVNRVKEITGRNRVAPITSALTSAKQNPLATLRQMVSPVVAGFKSGFKTEAAKRLAAIQDIQRRQKETGRVISPVLEKAPIDLSSVGRLANIAERTLKFPLTINRVGQDVIRQRSLKPVTDKLAQYGAEANGAISNVAEGLTGLTKDERAERLMLANKPLTELTGEEGMRLRELNKKSFQASIDIGAGLSGGVKIGGGKTAAGIKGMAKAQGPKKVAPKQSLIQEGVKESKVAVDEFKKMFPEAQVPKDKKAALPSREVFDEVIKTAKTKEATDNAARKVLQEIKTQKEPQKYGLYGAVRRALDPLDYADKGTQDIIRKWSSKNTVAKFLANEEAMKVDIPKQKGYGTITEYQSGKTGGLYDKIRSSFDDMFKEAKDRGIDVDYRKNYLPQVYSNKPEEVVGATTKYLKSLGVDDDIITAYVNGVDLPQDLANKFKLNPSFSQKRVFPDYKTAMKFGLKPKYNNPAQLLAHYREEMETTLNNKKLLDDLLDGGKITTVENAPKSWVSLNSPQFKGYYAPRETATVLNNLFGVLDDGPGAKVAKAVGDIARFQQGVKLSAGVPGTDLNFFAAGQTIKEITSGNVLSAPAALIRANFNGASLKWFKKNSDIMKKIAEQDIDIGNYIGSYKRNKNLVSAWSDMVSNKGVAKKIGFTWDKAFGDKTFNSLLPQFVVNNFKIVYKKALRRGLSEADASKLAGDTTKAFMYQKSIGRSRLTDDTLSSLFFAPKFREGIIRTLWNTGRSVTTQLRNPAFSKNRKLFAGMLGTYALYNVAQKKLTGNYLWENESGKEFELKIPISPGIAKKIGAKEGDYMYIPFMPSFMALPRAVAGIPIALAKGEFAEATGKAGQMLSMPVKTATDVISNKDYFGREIWREEGTTPEKLWDIASYVGKSVNHPYVEELYNQFVENKSLEKEIEKAMQDGNTAKAEKLQEKTIPLYQSITRALELPLKYSSKGKIERSIKYRNLDKVLVSVRGKSDAERKDIMQEYLNQLPQEDREWVKNQFYWKQISSKGLTFSQNKIVATDLANRWDNMSMAEKRLAVGAEVKRDKKFVGVLKEALKERGMSDEEKEMKNSTVEDRVTAIKKKLEGIDNKQDKRNYLADLKKKGILTQAVMDELNKK